MGSRGVASEFSRLIEASVAVGTLNLTSRASSLALEPIPSLLGILCYLGHLKGLGQENSGCESLRKRAAQILPDLGRGSTSSMSCQARCVRCSGGHSKVHIVVLIF